MVSLSMSIWEYTVLLLLRPLLAVTFVLFLISLGKTVIDYYSSFFLSLNFSLHHLVDRWVEKSSHVWCGGVYRLVCGVETGAGARASGARGFRPQEESCSSEAPNWSLFQNLQHPSRPKITFHLVTSLSDPFFLYKKNDFFDNFLIMGCFYLCWSCVINKFQ